MAVIWAIGDAGVNNSNALACAARIAGASPTHLLYLGDVYPDGSPSAFTNGYNPVWGSSAPTDLRTVTYPISGNYEWPQRARTGAYNDYWSAPMAAKGLPTTAPGNSTYSFAVDGWQIIMVNTEDAGGVGNGISLTAMTWLDAELTAADGRAIVCCHRPRWSPGARADDRSDQPDLDPMWDLLAGRAPLLLSGHSHLSAVMPEVDGTVQVIAGAGGDGFTTATEESSAGASAWVDASTVAVVRLDLADTIVCTFIGARSGATLHTIEIGDPAPTPSAGFDGYDARAFIDGEWVYMEVR